MTPTENFLSWEPFETELAGLARRATETDGTDRASILDLALAFHVWILKVSPVMGPWTALLERQAGQLVQGLKAGRPPAQGLERIAIALEDCRQNIQGSKDLLKNGKTAPEKQKDQEPLSAAQGSFLSLSPDDVPGFKDFLQEGPEHLASIEKNIFDIRRGISNEGLPVYRAFHTLKGIFGFLGFKDLTDLAHQAEALLEPYKSGEGQLGSSQAAWLLQTSDFFRDQFQLIAEGLPDRKIRLLSTEDFKWGYERSIEPQSAGPPDPVGTTEEREEDRTKAQKEEAYLRVPVPKMDLLLEAVEELTLWQSRASSYIEGTHLPPTLIREIQLLPQLTRQLQELVLSLRLVPAQPLFARVSQLAREVARQTGKRVRVTHEGGETELDKGLADQLFEPLLHLVRNAIDHGLESPAERDEAGKAPEGHLRLFARQEGPEFILEVEDDGRGLNLKKIREKGIALGFLGKEEKNEERIIQLIFQAGFSTADKVSQMSGRGVGLDAVQKRIHSFRGSIRVQSREGKGCRFLLRFPLAVALSDGVLVRAGRMLCLILVNQVERLLTLPDEAGSLEGLKDKQLGLGDNKMPFLDLAEYFGEIILPNRRPVAIHIQSSRKPFYLLVDEVLGKRQVVLRDLGGAFKTIPAVRGGALLGEGDLALILDVEELADSLSRTAPAGAGV